MVNKAELDKSYQRLAQRVHPGSRVVRVWKLEGGVSADVTGVELARADGQTARLVVRRHGARDRANNPNIAADEFRLLATLGAAGLYVPKPLLLDAAGEFFGEPAVVLEFVEGATDFGASDLRARLEQMCGQLVGLHRLEPAELDLPPLPNRREQLAAQLALQPARLGDSSDEGRIRALLTSLAPSSERNPTALLHGDYWLGNILWRDGQLVAVIDWEDAGVGDALADLGNSRLELLWAFGQEAMDYFTTRYRAAMPLDYTALAYWELAAALRSAPQLGSWGMTPAREQVMRAQLHWFVERALERL